MALTALIALTMLRLAVAAGVPLAPDEAYYWVWSRALAPGYPDHPPMVALWIRLGTSLIGDGPLGVRLLGPISVALASCMLADAGNRLLPGRHAGVHAAVLLNATLLLGAGAIIITPDTPLLVFWTACLWALARVVNNGSPLWWLAAGAFAGLAMDSKYTAALLWFGIVLWVIVTPSLREWLRRPAPWFGAILAVVLFLPVVWWNARHGWVSFARQGGRVEAWQPSNALRFLGELIAGQIGLLTPLIAAFCGAGIILAARQAWQTRAPAWTLLAALSVPAALLFVQHALGDRVQGNWPAIIYPAAVIAAADLRSKAWQRLRSPAVALGLAITLLVYLQASLALIPLPVRLDPTARQLAGWQALGAQVETVREQQGATFIAADEYSLAAELARAVPPGVTVAAVEPRWALFDLPRAKFAGATGILVRSERRGGNLEGEPWASASEIGQVQRRRAAETIETYRLYRVTTGPGMAVLTLLPGRS